MPLKPERPDVAQLAARDLSSCPFPAQGKESFRVFFDRKIHERIAAHAAEKLSLEICGVLVGDWHKDDNGPYVLINEAVRADKAQSNAGDVTFTHDAWNEVNREMDTRFADRKIVGWYHSHPSYGIFLSDRDRFCQDSTFNSPGHIAYVVDPVNGVEGVFCWRAGESKLLPHFWVGDEIHLSSKNKERQPSSAGPPEPAAPPAARQEPAPLSMLTLLLAAACMLLTGYLLGGMNSQRDRQELARNAVTYYGLIKAVKPGMRERLDAIDKILDTVIRQSDKLAAEHISMIPSTKDAKDKNAKDSGKDAADPREEKKKQWLDILTLAELARQELDRVNTTYSLTPEETAEVQRLIDEKEAADASAAKASAAKASGGQAPAKPSASPPPAKPGSEPVLPKATSEKPAAH